MSTITSANFVPCKTDSISEAVVSAVAEVLGTNPLDVEPLYGRIDPEALDALFSPMFGTSARRGGRIEFDHAGCDVSIVAENGDVHLFVTQRGA